MVIGERIRRTRLALGLTLDDLSSKLGNNPRKQTLSNYERGLTSPKHSLLIRLASVLNVPPSHFLEEPMCSIQWKGYRCHSRLNKTDKEYVKAYAEREAESQLWLMSVMRPNNEIRFPRQVEVKTMSDIEKAAQKLRAYWGLGDGPIDSVTDVIERNGGIVISWSESEKFDGMCGIANYEIPIIVYNSSVSTDRIRMNLAHELGHFLISGGNGIRTKDEENFAFSFGAAFLVPEQSAKAELGKPRKSITFSELGLLKQRWGLSMQAWIRRARDIEYISENEYKRLNVEIRRKKWHREEPVSYEGNEKPIVMKLMVLRALTEEVIDEVKARDLCPLIFEEKEFSENMRDEGRISFRQLACMTIEDRRKILMKAMEGVEPDTIPDDWDSVLSEAWE